MALLGMFLIIITAGYWAFFGVLNENVSADGIYLHVAKGESNVSSAVEKGKDSLAVLCYVPLSTGKKIQTGMEVNVLPSTVNAQDTGYLLGQVVSVGSYGISEEEMMNQLNDDILVSTFRSAGVLEPVVEVEIQLYTDDHTKSGYAWSGKRGDSVVLSDYTMVEAIIITKTMSPFEKFISSIYG